jgi:hypothetical protein
VLTNLLEHLNAHSWDSAEVIGKAFVHLDARFRIVHKEWEFREIPSPSSRIQNVFVLDDK